LQSSPEGFHRNQGQMMRASRFQVSMIVVALMGVIGCDRAMVAPDNALSIIKSISIMGGDNQSGVVNTELPRPLVIEALDASGNPVSGQTVNFVVASGGGHVFAGASTTDKNGMAQEYWTLGKITSEAQVVEVRSVNPTTGEKKVYGQFSAVPLAGPPLAPDRLRYDGLEDCVAPTGAVTHPYLLMLDEYGNPAPGGQAEFTITAGGGSLAAAQVTSGGDGKAAAALTLGPPGKQSIVATSFGKTYFPDIRNTFLINDCWAYPTAGRTLADGTNRKPDINPASAGGIFQFYLSVLANGTRDEENIFAGRVTEVTGGGSIVSINSGLGGVGIMVILGPTVGLNTIQVTVPGIGSIPLEVTTTR
jgi:hypothetical protein